MLDYRGRARPVLQQQLTCVSPSEEEVVTPFSAAVNLSATELIGVRALRKMLESSGEAYARSPGAPDQPSTAATAQGDP